MKRILTLFGAAGLAFSTSAHAVDFFPGTATPTANFTVNGDPFSGPVSASFGRSGLEIGTFTDRFLFILGQVGFGSGSITTNFSGLIGNPTDLDFGEVTFNNGTSTFNVPIFDIGNQETGGLSNIAIDLGAINTLSVSYTSRGSGSFGGSLNFIPREAPPVPEPATWAMLIVGFAVVGSLLRRRRKDSTRVRYAF